MKAKAHYNPKSKKQIISFIVMIIVTIALVFASASLAKSITEKNKATQEIDFNVNLTTPIAVKENELNVTGIEKAFDTTGNLIGYIVKTKTIGYNAEVPIETATTITKDGKTVVGIEILKQEETEYLGVKIQQDSFKNQFNGKKLPIADSSTVEKGSKVDVIAKSTISSTAVIEAVNNASEYVNTYVTE